MRIIMLLILTAFGYCSRAEDPPSDLERKLIAYYNETQNGRLFLHLDKTNYKPNEHIWFKAYLLGNYALENKTLHVSLLDSRNKRVLSREFPTYDLLSNGELWLPDSLQGGDYTFLAYTDRMLNFSPEQVFIQPIRLIRNSIPSKIDLSISDSSTFQPNKKAEFIVRLSSNRLAVDKAKGDFIIANAQGEVIQEGKFSTDQRGEAKINFMYPAIEENEQLFVDIKVQKGGLSNQRKILLPKYARRLLIHAYPEDGQLIYDVPGKLIIKTKTLNGTPLPTKVILKADGQELSAIKTDANGLGLCLFTPKRHATYQLHYVYAEQQQVFDLPLKIAEKGLTLHIEESDSLPRIFINNKGLKGKFRILIRQRERLISQKAFEFLKDDTLFYNLPARNGLLVIGLFNEQGSLLAQRLYRPPADKRYRVNIAFDKSQYGTREKVKAKVIVKDESGNPVAANLSVAVVYDKTRDSIQEKRITLADLDKLNEIPFVNLPEHDLNLSLAGNGGLLDEWRHILSFRPSGSLKILANSAGIFGRVKDKRNKKMEISELYIYSNRDLITVPVNTKGVFSIPAEELIVEQDEKKYLILNDEFRTRYTIQMTDYTDDFEKRIIHTKAFENQLLIRNSNREELPPSFLTGIVLEEVNIHAQRNTSMARDITTYHSSDCTDYVCFYNILNCPNHIGEGTKPVDGQVYYYKGKQVRYYGCTYDEKKENNLVEIKNIALPIAFYLPDYAQNPIPEPELQTTIYWNPNVDTSAAAADSSLEFYTSDVQGTFKLIVQGLDSEDLNPVYGESSFMVLK